MVPVGAWHEELILLLMEYTENQIIDIILKDLYSAGSYSQYLDSKKREISTEMQTKEVTKHNIRLNNWKLSIALIAAIISLIVSIFAILKSSNTIERLRELFHQNGIKDVTHWF